MRAVAHYKNSNLSWKLLKQNLAKYTTQTTTNILSNTGYKPIYNDCDIVNANISLPVQEYKTLFVDKIDNNEASKHLINGNFLECTVNSCLPVFKNELKTLFTDRNISGSNSDDLTAVCFNHHTINDMSTWSSEVSKERELLATIFIEISKEICEALKEGGFWADFIDPFSGTPYYGSHTNDALFEVDPRMRNFGYRIRDLGCCKVLSHPQWAEHLFANILFTNAPIDNPLLASVIQHHHHQQQPHNQDL